MFETSKPMLGIDINNIVKPKIAYIDDVPYTLIPGETI